MMPLVLDIMEFAAAGGPVSARENHAPDTGGESTGGGDPDTDALRRLETYLLAKPDITGTGILISLHTGLRISEVCALRWEDIDFRKAVLHVRSTVARVRGTDGGTATRLIIDTPKTKSSLRDIPLSRQLMLLLPLYENVVRSTSSPTRAGL
ncbi:MAG: tyrosine-type recombinase/integrase [Dysosmobacter sp.]